MKRIFITTLIGLSILSACNKTEDEPSPSNSAPGAFTTSTSQITETSALLSWTAASDSDGDEVSYAVTGTSGFKGSEVFTSKSTTSGMFTGLSANTSYGGEVEADDGNGGTSKSSFSFTTTGTTNSPPGSFTVSIGDIYHDGADLSWTAAIDPDGDNVTYEIEVSSSSYKSGLTSTSQSLTGQGSGESISGKVIATDGNGGSSEASFDFTSYVIDISLYESMAGFVSATLVDCNYSGGGSGKCYEIKFSSNPVDDDGPFCPSTTYDVGGFGNYDGDTNPGFQVMKAALFLAMEEDDYDIISNSPNPDGSYDITIETNVPGGGRLDMSGPSSAACLQPAPDDGLTLSFQIPVIPQSSTKDDIESVEYVGLALDGVPINGTPPSVVANNGKIPSLDRCGGHHDPSGYYHWHFISAYMDATLSANNLLDADAGIECSKQTQSATALVGYARDGYPIYSGKDMGDVTPTGLDPCNGHNSATEEYPDGIYHYHASTGITNVPPCTQGKYSIDAFVKPTN